ncbi:MAG: hypothetical protein ACI3V2_02090 [Faecousia sp.]
MKIKKLIAILIAVVLVASAVMSVSAEDLSDVTPDNSTEVTANIVDPGTISYVITIPATAEFGTLTQPDSIENDNYVFYSFQVEATELNILSDQAVTVYMKDSSAEDNQFYLSQKDAADPFTIAYDVYDTAVDEETVGNYAPINTTATLASYGYHLCTFRAGSTGAKQDVTLALNQNALYGKTLSEIAGDYSGTIAFHSALIVTGG